jgi:hypothetical protein
MGDKSRVSAPPRASGQPPVLAVPFVRRFPSFGYAPVIAHLRRHLRRGGESQSGDALLQGWRRRVLAQIDITTMAATCTSGPPRE